MTETIPKSEIFLLLAVIAALQWVLSVVFPQGLLVDLPLIFAVYIGWHSPRVKGAASGALFGLLRDLGLGLSLGVNGIAKTLLGFWASSFRKWMAPEGFSARFVFLAAVSALDDALIYATLALLDQPLLPGLWTRLLMEAFLTALFGAAIFAIYDRYKFPRRDFRNL